MTRDDATAILRKYPGHEHDRSMWDPEDRATFEAWETAELERKALERAEREAVRALSTLPPASTEKT